MVNIEDIIKDIENLSVVEANDLAKKMAEKFNISLDQIQTGGNNAQQEKKKESESVSVIVKKYDPTVKIPLIKLCREITGLGLSDALKLVSTLPFEIKKDISSTEAEEIKKKITAISSGIEIEIK